MRNQPELSVAAKQAVDRIMAAPIATEPFPHFVVDDLLDPELYGRLMAAWPDGDLFKVNQSMQRWQMHFSDRMHLLPAEQQEIWHEVLALVRPMNRAILERMSGYLDSKFYPYYAFDWREVLGDARIHNDGAQLAAYRGHAELAPHVDHPVLLTNAFVYMSEREGEEADLGTWLYRGKGLMLPFNINLTPDVTRRAIEKASVVPYKANRCLAYLNGPRSFHGVEPMDMGERERRLFMFGNVLTREDTIALFGETLLP